MSEEIILTLLVVSGFLGIMFAQVNMILLDRKMSEEQYDHEDYIQHVRLVRRYGTGPLTYENHVEICETIVGRK